MINETRTCARCGGHSDMSGRAAHCYPCTGVNTQTGDNEAIHNNFGLGKGLSPGPYTFPQEELAKPKEHLRQNEAQKAAGMFGADVERRKTIIDRLDRIERLLDNMKEGLGL